ncbi:hypothetical protein [Paraclostridium bifermentans]|uniref:hypothetical protein n=1 Tax=Paraclostridium bifermentans TaxID=1490 RepID=UPI001FF17935|nr:hypothetical protein [Paraclostridium bifermentans]UOW66855.1 hypothetical protein MTR78_09860 [Paraclostridium bifermentans]
MQWYKNITELDSFIYGATSSTFFNFAFEADNLKPFERDFELLEVMGRDGDLLVDNKRRKSKEVNIKGYLICDGVEPKAMANKFNTWLVGEVKYKPLKFSNDSTEYEAIVVGEIDMKERFNGIFDVSFKFSCMEVVK